MPVIDHVPFAATVVVFAVVVCVPSLATTEMVAPAVPVPLAEVLVALLPLIGLVTVVTATLGATVSLVAVFVAVAVLPPASEMVTV